MTDMLNVMGMYGLVGLANSGKRRWMAGGELNSKGINYLPYGVFR